MVRPVFLLFELIMYGLFAGCLWHASRQDRYRVVELFFGLIYGVFLEWMTIQQLSAYEYGQFLIMFDGAPLAIGVGWAIIIYTAMEFTNRLAMPDLPRALLDGLLALNIDLAMDVIAIRLHMWDWAIPLDAEWFGVPWGNFWAWFIVVTSFSAALRALRHWRSDRIRRWLYIPLAFFISIAILALTNRFFVDVLQRNNQGFTGMALLLGSALLFVLAVRPRIAAGHAGPPEPIVIAVPLTFHLLFIGAGFYYGFFAELPILAVISLAMLVLGVALHLWPWLAQRRQAGGKAAELSPARK